MQVLGSKYDFFQVRFQISATSVRLGSFGPIRTYCTDKIPSTKIYDLVDLRITWDFTLKRLQHVANIVNKFEGVIQNILKAS